MSVDKAVNNAVASMRMEGYYVDGECINLCKKLLNNEINMEQYIELVKKNSGMEFPVDKKHIMC